MSSAIGIVGLVVAIAGGSWSLGVPPWVSQRTYDQDMAAQSFQGLQTRDDLLEQQISDLELQKKSGRDKYGSKWGEFQENELNKLKKRHEEVERLLDTLGKGKK